MHNALAACYSVIFQRLHVLVCVSVDRPSMFVGNNERALTDFPHNEAIHCVLSTKVTVFFACCNSEVFRDWHKENNKCNVFSTGRQVKQDSRTSSEFGLEKVDSGYLRRSAIWSKHDQLIRTRTCMWKNTR